MSERIGRLEEGYNKIQFAFISFTINLKINFLKFKRTDVISKESWRSIIFEVIKFLAFVILFYLFSNKR